MRDVTLRDAKATLRAFFAAQPVEYLTRIVDECRAGTFGFWDRCHCVRGLGAGGYDRNSDPLFLSAERALATFAKAIFAAEMTERDCRHWGSPQYFYENGLLHEESDPLVRVRTLPIVLAEISRRERQQPAEVQKEQVSA